MTTQPNAAILLLTPTKAVLMDWIKAKLDDAAFVGEISVDDLSDLEQHIRDLASAIA